MTLISGDERRTDRPAYFESMTYNLVRGWAPLRGVIDGRDEVHRPADPRALRPGQRSAEANTTRRRSERRAAVMHNLLRTYNVAPPHRPGQESRERPRPAVTRLRVGQRRRARPSTPKPTTRSASWTSTAICTRRRGLRRTADDRGDRAARERHRAPRRHGRRVHLARARALGGRAARPAHRRARSGLDGTARRIATSASGSACISPRAAPIRRKCHRSCSRGCRRHDAEALNGLGVALADAGATATREAFVGCWCSIRPTGSR